MVGARWLPPGPLITVGELLPAWLAAEHPWKPSTVVGYRSTVKALLQDAVADLRVMSLSPRVVRDRVEVWARAGVGPAVAAARVRVLRSAVAGRGTNGSWRSTRCGSCGARPGCRLVDRYPTTTSAPCSRPRNCGCSKPTPTTPRSTHPGPPTPVGQTPACRGEGRLHRAEQDLLLVRLAADTGARRGELAALQIQDLDGRVLRIDKAVSAGVLTTPKSGHGRVLTLGATTAELWHTFTHAWNSRAGQPVGPWLFSPDAGHQRRLGAEALGHRFDQIRDAAGVPGATLHRLRHNVATYLVAHGQILQAQARLGHADAATTLREYAYALPLTDATVADALDAHLNRPRDEPVPSSNPQPPTRDQR